jgi:hypothetical protein
VGLPLCHRNCNTPTPPQVAFTSASTSTLTQPHMSFVSVVLTCSAAPRSPAPSSPMRLPLRLPMCKCEHWPRSWGLPPYHCNCNTPLPPQIASTSTSTSQPHCSVVSVVLTRSAAPKYRAPATPMLFQERLLCASVNWPRSCGTLFVPRNHTSQTLSNAPKPLGQLAQQIPSNPWQ